MKRAIRHHTLLGVVLTLVASTAGSACDETTSAVPLHTPTIEAGTNAPIDPKADAANPSLPSGDPVDMPIDGITAEQLKTFSDGDALFALPLREADGLGPLYTRPSCAACHEGGLRGPGLVQKMAVVMADGVTPAVDQSKLAFGHTVHPLMTAGATLPIVPPENDPSIKVTVRVGPPVLGRGYMEAVLDSEIERVAAEQSARSDGIRGRINRVAYTSEPNPDARFHAHAKGDMLIGRFGAKARIATVDDFVADALLGDMGITSPLRPTEFANPDALSDDLKPGIDVTVAAVNVRADYIRLIAIPKRGLGVDDGPVLFDRAKCNVCHVPSLKTRPDYPIAQLAGIDAPVYTDFLLHDMGASLSDGLPDGVDGAAHARDWRTAPLVGLRFYKTFLHDSRAHSVEEAIELHGDPGSEARSAVEVFQAMTPNERATLIEFVSGL